MPDTNDIETGSDAWSDEQLLSYLQGNLSPEKMHEVEKQMINDSFVNDAIEGLQQFSSNKKLADYVRQLNQHLQQQTAAQKQRNQKRRLKDLPWIIQALIIVLFLSLLAYGVVVFVRYH